MKRVFTSLIVSLTVFSASQQTYSAAHLIPPGAMDPSGVDIHMAYESDTFTPGKPNTHLPGAALAAPGDVYRFTLIREDKYASDPDYEVVKAVAGVHIDDYDSTQGAADEQPEWGRILINGSPMQTIKGFPNDTRPPQSSGLVEIIGDAEISKPGGPLMPPYVFDVTELTRRGKWLTFEVINVRKDGSTSMQGDAPFGGFVVNRIGYHVWYKKRSGKAE